MDLMLNNIQGLPKAHTKNSAPAASCLSESASWRRNEFLQLKVFGYFFGKHMVSYILPP